MTAMETYFCPADFGAAFSSSDILRPKSDPIFASRSSPEVRGADGLGLEAAEGPTVKGVAD
jgi:hypothetical protein